MVISLEKLLSLKHLLVGIRFVSRKFIVNNNNKCFIDVQHNKLGTSKYDFSSVIIFSACRIPAFPKVDKIISHIDCISPGRHNIPRCAYTIAEFGRILQRRATL